MADCTFLLESFTYDGAGPQTYWTIASGTNETKINGDSVRVQDDSVEDAFDNECSAQTTKEGFEWGDVAEANEIVLGLWCNTANQLFGAAILTKPATPAADASPATCDAAPGATPGSSSETSDSDSSSTTIEITKIFVVLGALATILF